MNRDDLKTIALGLLFDGMLVEELTPKAKQELRDAIDAVLRLSASSYGGIDKGTPT